MKIIKDQQITEDSWSYLNDISPELAPEELPAGDIIVPYAYWLEHKTVLISRDAELGLAIDGFVETETLVDDLSYFSLIALVFPAFADGRSYSHARLLRDRYEFQGELRAVGDVLRDQLFYMHRCGIDSYALREDKDFEDALAAFKEFSVTYQTAADGAQPIYRVR